ncbi:HD domain-containing protein [Alsobacter sp. R-9]
MDHWIRVLKAADAAARWHVHQRRKGPAREPYINHLLEVAALVTEATEGRDPDLVIAALLHDAIEDQEVPRAVIAAHFGEDVARLVEEVTDDKDEDKATRKRHQVEHAPKKSARAARLKMADKTSNLRAVAKSPGDDWSVQRRLDYVAWAREVVGGLKAQANDPWLLARFEEAADAAERSVQPFA